jgi:hypothetical protein
MTISIAPRGLRVGHVGGGGFVVDRELRHAALLGEGGVKAGDFDLLAVGREGFKLANACVMVTSRVILFVILVMTGGQRASWTSLSGTLAEVEHRPKSGNRFLASAMRSADGPRLTPRQRGVGEPILWWAGPPSPRILAQAPGQLAMIGLRERDCWFQGYATVPQAPLRHAIVTRRACAVAARRRKECSNELSLLA